VNLMPRRPLALRRHAAGFTVLVLMSACGRVEPPAPTQVPYWQWWDPACANPGEPCTKPGCSAVLLLASAIDGCSPNTNITTGCMIPLTDNFWDSYALENHQLVATGYAPYSYEGMTECPLGTFNNPPAEQVCCLWLDAGRGSDASSATDAQ
jgi:hypothetical protein